MLRIVVLGTGTGVGKTTVTVALSRTLVSLGAAVQALKPIESGYPATAESLTSSDAHQLAVASNSPPGNPSPLYAFADPISPHLAAHRASALISPAAVAEWCAAHYRTLRDTTSGERRVQLVESAGGACSPLSSRETNLDLTRALAPCRTLLVAADCLGVLHDVRATWLALRACGLTLDYLVLSAAGPADASTGTNARELPRVGLPQPTDYLGNPAGHLPRLAQLVLAHARASVD